MIAEVTERKISQFRDGSFGRLSSHEGGMPVYCSTVFMPDCGGCGPRNTLSPPFVVIAWTVEGACDGEQNVVGSVGLTALRCARPFRAHVREISIDAHKRKLSRKGISQNSEFRAPHHKLQDMVVRGVLAG